MVKKHLWTITEGTKFAHCIELKCIQGNYTNVSLNTFLRDDKVNCTGPKTIEVNASDASTRENDTLIWIKTCKYNNYMWKKNTRLIMKLKLSKQDVDGIDQNLVFNQNVTLKKTITNLQPQDLSFKLPSFKLPKSKFQNCINIHGCSYQKIPNQNFNPTCLNDTVSIHFNKGLLKSKSVTIYCHQDIHWSMRINIRVQDDATSVFVVISMFAAMLTIGNVQLYFILYHFFEATLKLKLIFP